MDLNHTYTEDKIWVGRDAAHNFTVTILPEVYICRRECTMRKKKQNIYYVWHNGGKYSEGKIKYAKSNKLWYLREDWFQTAKTNNTTGIQWLIEMTIL